MNIYESGVGDALLDPVVHTNIIREYLAAERAHILKCLPVYDVLIEAGCSDGRYAEDALNLNKAYVGVDRVVRYLLEGMTRYPKGVFVHEDVLNIEGILKDHIQQYSRSLIVVPFNIIGILSNAELFLARLLATGYHFLLFSFKTDAWSTEARE